MKNNIYITVTLKKHVHYNTCEFMGNGNTEDRKLHKSVLCNCVIVLENSYNSYFFLMTNIM